MDVKINISKAMKFLGIKKGSRSMDDYEKAKRWLHYTPCDQDEYDKYMKKIVDFIEV